MSKKQHIPKGQKQMYIRPSKGYQQNMMKSMPENLKMPDMPTKKQTIIMHVVAAIVIAAVAYLCIRFIAWWAVFIPIILILAYFVLFARYMNKKQKSVIEYYQKMGVTKKIFYKQLERQNMKQSNIDTMSRMWDIVAGSSDYKITFIDRLLGL